MENDIQEASLKELIQEIIVMLKGNPRAVRLVYSFLVGFTHGAGKAQAAEPAEIFLT